MSRARRYALRAVEFLEAAVVWLAASLVAAIVAVCCFTSFHPETQTRDVEQPAPAVKPVRVDRNLV